MTTARMAGTLGAFAVSLKGSKRNPNATAASKGAASMIRTDEARPRNNRRMTDAFAPGPGGRFFGVAVRGSTYLRTLYLLAGFPFSIATWVALVTLLSVGAGLAVTVVGIPLLIITMYLWCYNAAVERLFANTLLGARIRPLPFGVEGDLNAWARIKARLRNPYTWRTLAFLLLLRFPMGIAGFFWVTTILGTLFNLLIVPFNLLFGVERPMYGVTIDTPWEAALCVLAGIALVVPALHLLSFGGWFCGRITEWALQSPARPGEPWGESFDHAVTAAVTWPGVAGRRLTTAARRERSIQLRVWLAHAGLYALVMAVLLVIDVLATPGQWWVLWPAWGWGMALALHTGYLLGGLLGGHALLFAVAGVGFFIIDAELVTDSTWFFWPLVSWGIALAFHAFLYFGFAPVRAEE